MMNQEEPAVIEAGAPSYLLLLDALILTYPNDDKLLLAGSRLYGAYAGSFASNEQEAKSFANKSMEYAQRALCRVKKKSCYMTDRSEEHTSELQSRPHLVCRLLLEKKKNKYI